MKKFPALSAHLAIFFSVFLTIQFLLFPSLTLAAVSNFVFITHPQAVLPGKLSKEITIQSQNGNGAEEKLGETFDIEFISTSKTGEFLGSTGKPVTKTMSKGTAKKTFYYEDPTKGDFEVFIVATSRTSKETFSVSQKITIGQAPLPKPAIKEALKEVSQNAGLLKPEASSTGIQIATSTQTQEIFVAPARAGFFSSIMYWPIKIFHLTKRLFVES